MTSETSESSTGTTGYQARWVCERCIENMQAVVDV